MQTFSISFPCELCYHKRTFETDTLQTDRIGSNTLLSLSTITSSLSFKILHNIPEPCSFSIINNGDKSSTKSQRFKAYLVTVAYVEVDFRKIWCTILSYCHPQHANENEFTWVNSLFILRLIPGPLPNCFSFTSFLSGTHQKLPCGKWFKIPLPLFPFNYLTISHSGIEWDHWWDFTFCLKLWIKICSKASTKLVANKLSRYYLLRKIHLD